jgi:ferrous iron transport protein B
VLSYTDDVIIALNLIDEAQKKGIEIDIDVLSQRLGAVVVPTAAKSKNGLSRLICAISNYRKSGIEKTVTRRCIEDTIREAHDISNAALISDNADKVSTFDKIITSKLYGIPIMLLMLSVIFYITLTLSNYPSELLMRIFSASEELLSDSLRLPYFLDGILIKGIFRTTSWVVSVMLPPMAIFFPLFALLEDIGVLPRIAFNMDKSFRHAGADGKQSLTMCMGFGCNACGVESARIIYSKKQRLIAILTNTFVPCNGRFPMLIVLSSIFIGGTVSGTFGRIIGALSITALIIIGVAVTLIVSKILSLTILKGNRSSFILELPPYRKPSLRFVLWHSFKHKTMALLMRAVKVAAPFGAVIWLMSNTTIGDVTLFAGMINLLDGMGRAIGMNGIILTAFVLGFPANEIVLPIILMGYTGMSTMTDIESIDTIRGILQGGGFTLTNAVCTMLFCLCHFPCATTCLTIKKETGSSYYTALSAIIPTVTGIAVCFVVAMVMGVFV